ncbi:hypothetical protein IW261DRAFT_791339 [Armillaria novae-zelandiae]|uniref:BTB domain-containing protein n=1 Tax=Armillaria novae-zelandiae TaxID=153914 RepID=A0AA39PL47_9AGAR|nr:hypothetical protein IW261DRAFT_791339 [Armillaria novae-zelandiae]
MMSGNATSSDSQRTIRSVRFYWEPVIFLVENQLFRVARHLFVNTSEVFSTMFSLPQDNVGVVDGSDDEHPLILQGVESADFENMLEALVVQQRTATLDQRGWVSVLKLATMWGMHDVRRLAIKELNKLRMSDVDLHCLWKRVCCCRIGRYQATTIWLTAKMRSPRRRFRDLRCLLVVKVWQAQTSISNSQPGRETTRSCFGKHVFFRGGRNLSTKSWPLETRYVSPKPSFIRHIE